MILKPVTFWARGERNIGGVLPLIILTNCEAVELRYGTNPPKTILVDRARFPHLPHPPIIVDRHHFTGDELGRWGMSWEDASVTGLINGQPVATARFVAGPVPTTLQVVADATEIGPRDAVRVMVRVQDQVGNTLPFFADPVTITVSGAGHRIGPRVVPLRAGSTGFWVQATERGAIKVTVSLDRLGESHLDLVAK